MNARLVLVLFVLPALLVLFLVLPALIVLVLFLLACVLAFGQDHLTTLQLPP